MSRLDDIILEAIDDWATQGRSDEQIHGVKNFFSGRGGRLPQQIKDLMLELIGDPGKADNPGRYNCIMEFCQKVQDL
jgi:hypothetical protein